MLFLNTELLRQYLESTSAAPHSREGFKDWLIKLTEDGRQTNSKQKHAAMALVWMNSDLNPNSATSLLTIWLGNGAESPELLKKSSTIATKLNQIADLKLVLQVDYKTFWEIVPVRLL